MKYNYITEIVYILYTLYFLTNNTLFRFVSITYCFEKFIKNIDSPVLIFLQKLSLSVYIPTNFFK
jgi:hypothetical protein